MNVYNVIIFYSTFKANVGHFTQIDDIPLTSITNCDLLHADSYGVDFIADPIQKKAHHSARSSTTRNWI